MLRSFRSSNRVQYVTNSTHKALGASQLHPVSRVLRANLSSTISKPSLSQSPAHKISVFLPHEELKIKALKAIQRKNAKTLQGTASPSPSKPGVATNGEPTSISSSHYDLPTYLSYHSSRLALHKTNPPKQAALDKSYVHLGTRYEYLIQSHLASHLGLSLTRIGGKGDGGVDLIGTWTVPKPADQPGGSLTAKFKVFLQAKRFAPHRKPSPSLMREVEGSLLSAPYSRPLKEAFAAHLIRVNRLSPSISRGTHDEDVEGEFSSKNTDADDTEITQAAASDLPDLGILVTTRPLTDGVEKAMANSRHSLMYICLEEIPFEMSASKGKQHSSTDEASEDVPEAGRENEQTPASSEDADLEPDSPVPASVPAVDDEVGSLSERNAWSIPKTRIKQIAWNQAAARDGLLGYEVITKHTGAADLHGTDQDQEAILTYQGRPVILGSY